MYASYFNLREPPFSIAPDPSFLYMSPRHQEALGHLLYGTGQYGGFVQLTGEVGTGKTTIVRTLLRERLDHVDVAIIHNPRQSELEFVQSICDELKVPYEQPPSSIKALVDALNQHLLRAHAEGQRTVLIIDEAQNLAPQVLEQVRLLTNLETDKEKLLRIMLIGQPELIELLERPELRQLASRITARYHLTPLSVVETVQYIIHRLRVAGGAADLFTDTAMRRVHRYSRGVPRRINIICDRALLGAYAKGLRHVTPELVDHAAVEVLGEPPRRKWNGLVSRKPPVAWIETALAVAALIVAGVLLREVLGGTHSADKPRAAAAPAAAAAATDAPPLRPTPATFKPAAEAEAGLGALRAGAQPLPQVMSRLIALWDRNIKIGHGENVCEALARQSLQCYKSSGQWSDLAQLNRPAILTLNVDHGQVQYVLLRALSGEAAVIDSRGSALHMPLARLSPLWTGEFLLLWRREVDTNLIGPGIRGEAVVWLRKRLAEASGTPLPPPIPDRFGPELRASLVRFQTAHGLDADGVAGIRTLIALSDVKRSPDTPTLQGGT